MLSASSLTINWLPPDIEEEMREFFTHPAKQDWYRLHDVTWEKILSGFDTARLVPYPRSDRIGGIEIAHSYHTFEDYLEYVLHARRGYRRNYSKMENDLQSAGTLSIKAPIVLTVNGKGLLFSGYRRLCLAWNYRMIPYIWLVDIGGITKERVERTE